MSLLKYRVVLHTGHASSCSDAGGAGAETNAELERVAARCNTAPLLPPTGRDMVKACGRDSECYCCLFLRVRMRCGWDETELCVVEAEMAVEAPPLCCSGGDRFADARAEQQGGE